MMKKKILILNTQYTFLIFLLINDIDLKEVLFFFGSTLHIKNFKFQKYEIKEIESANKISIFLQELLLNIKILVYLFRKINLKIEIYGQDHILGANIFKKFYKFNLIEDGIANYDNLKIQDQIKNLKTKTKLKKIKFFLLSYSSSYGLSKNIKKIYLTGLAPIPKEIAHKVELINLKNLWDKKNLEEQNEILDIFSFDLNIKEKIKGRDIILFTQPLSEDNITTEEEKIKIYSIIVKKYPKNSLIIKTHPREKTNYKNIFKEYLILDNPFPFEILNLLDIKFSKAITLFSTSALGLGVNVKVDFYGTEVHPKVLERFGNLDNIMKRNCFLEDEQC